MDGILREFAERVSPPEISYGAYPGCRPPGARLPNPFKCCGWGTRDRTWDLLIQSTTDRQPETEQLGGRCCTALCYKRTFSLRSPPTLPESLRPPTSALSVWRPHQKGEQ